MDHCSSFLLCKIDYINSLPNHSDDHVQEDFENVVGKGENAAYQHFLLFPQCFLPSSRQTSVFK